MKAPTLALLGGPPVRKALLSYGRQCIEPDDEAAVLDALRSDFLTQGPRVPAFEKAFAKAVGRKYAVAFSNGTAALHGMYAACDVGPGTRVLVPALTFAATANAARFLGADVAFADVDPLTALVDPADAAKRITRKTRVLCVVHYGGMLAPMPELRALARRKGLVLVEDACHALGADGYGARAGAFGEMAAFSFHPVKTITTGEGGMVVTDSASAAQRLRTFRTHGIVRDAGRERRNGAWHYEMRSLGFNYRLTDLQCALGLTQLAKLPRFLTQRREIAAQYDRFFRAFDGLVPCPVPEGTTSAYHLYPILVEERRFRGGRRAVFDALRAEGIGVQVHYVPVNAHPYYRRLGFRASDTPGAGKFYRRVLSIPIFPGMSRRDVLDVCDALEKVTRGLGR